MGVRSISRPVCFSITSSTASSNLLSTPRKYTENMTKRMKTTNDQGVNTIEASVIIRDQSFEGASLQLLGVLEGLTKPAQAQLG